MFEQHPEFFKTYTLRGEPRVLLRLALRAIVQFRSEERSSKRRRRRTTSRMPDDADEATNHRQSQPLSADQIQVLINTAIELHAQEAAADSQPERFRRS